MDKGAEIRRGGPKLPRRRFLEKAGKAALVILGAVGFGVQPAKSAEAEGIPETNDTLTSKPREIIENGIRIFIGADNLPSHYLTPEGTTVQFDKAVLLKAKQEAIANKERAYAAIIPDYSYKQPELPGSKSSPEHPVYDEKPDRTLNEEQLKERGINIIQSPDVELYIRSGAFEKENPLDTFAEGGSRKLTIVIMDSLNVASPFLREDKYAGVAGYIDDELKKPEFIEKTKTSLEKSLGALRSLRQSRPQDRDIQTKIQEVKEQIYRLSNTPEDLMLKQLAETDPKSGKIAGVYIPPFDPNLTLGPYQKTTGDPNSAVIFLALGASTIPPRETKMYFDEDGNFKAETVKTNLIRPLTPKEGDSMPNPADLEMIEGADEITNSGSYAISAESGVFVLLHELGHDWLIGRAIHLGQKPDYSEFRADIEALNKVEQTSERWTESRFSDDSASNFAIRIPDGRYIIFQSPQQRSSQIAA